jgi:hypothetical protein
MPVLVAYLRSLPQPERFAGSEVQAPVLVLPNVFEPEFGDKLIRRYETDGNEETGFMQDAGGKTVQKLDAGHKRRRDHLAGFILAHLQRLPTGGEHLEVSGWRFEVVDLDDRPIDKVLASRVPVTRRQI